MYTVNFTRHPAAAAAWCNANGAATAAAARPPLARLELMRGLGVYLTLRRTSRHGDPYADPPRLEPGSQEELEVTLRTEALYEHRKHFPLLLPCTATAAASEAVVCVSYPRDVFSQVPKVEPKALDPDAPKLEPLPPLPEVDFAVQTEWVASKANVADLFDLFGDAGPDVDLSEALREADDKEMSEEEAAAAAAAAAAVEATAIPVAIQRVIDTAARIAKYMGDPDQPDVDGPRYRYGGQESVAEEPRKYEVNCEGTGLVFSVVK